MKLFDAILRDASHGGVDRQTIVDAMNQTIGQCEERLRKELWRAVDPLYWVKAATVFVIRIPFMIVSVSGFEVSKVEDHVLARVFKLAEIPAIVYLLLWLGLTKTETGEMLKSFLSK